jgi:hypothetical protein
MSKPPREKNATFELLHGLNEDITIAHNAISHAATLVAGEHPAWQWLDDARAALQRMLFTMNDARNAAWRPA